MIHSPEKYLKKNTFLPDSPAGTLKEVAWLFAGLSPIAQTNMGTQFIGKLGQFGMVCFGIRKRSVIKYYAGCSSSARDHTAEKHHQRACWAKVTRPRIHTVDLDSDTIPKKMWQPIIIGWFTHRVLDRVRREGKQTGEPSSNMDPHAQIHLDRAHAHKIHKTRKYSSPHRSHFHVHSGQRVKWPRFVKHIPRMLMGLKHFTTEHLSHFMYFRESDHWHLRLPMHHPMNVKQFMGVYETPHKYM